MTIVGSTPTHRNRHNGHAALGGLGGVLGGLLGKGAGGGLGPGGDIHTWGGSTSQETDSSDEQASAQPPTRLELRRGICGDRQICDRPQLSARRCDDLSLR
ncbi:hypothetical protein C5613_02310 [Rhodococcus opacus]|uniref:Uncharacterized protein n=1 Tax=Rhodococcus opacus TaxID=37919 RepID=A0A2S8JHZ2_RHOOP|nr:hypothetical protein C5613_02310 [Rhodococcus opacus]